MENVNNQQREDEHIKLKELILYIANRLALHPKFGATKLNKILFFSDFIAYYRLGEPITDEKYIKLEKGPAPKFLIKVKEEMESTGEIVCYSVDTLRGEQKRIAPKRPADLSKFTAEQIAIVDKVIELLAEKDAEDVSELSHFFMGWRIVKDKEEIPYETVFLKDPKEIVVTERHRKIAKDVIERNGLTR